MQVYLLKAKMLAPPTGYEKKASFIFRYISKINTNVINPSAVSQSKGIAV
jgi:hypothetical protein